MIFYVALEIRFPCCQVNGGHPLRERPMVRPLPIHPRHLLSLRSHRRERACRHRRVRRPYPGQHYRRQVRAQDSERADEGQGRQDPVYERSAAGDEGGCTMFLEMKFKRI